MKRYGNLTERGKLRRLYHLSMQALEEYDLEIHDVSFFKRGCSTLFKVVTKMGEKYVFRICSDQDSTLDENKIEVAWLNAIQRDTGVHALVPVARRDGEYITMAKHPGIQAGLRCVLHKWIPGHVIGESVNVTHMDKLGVIMATLHNQSERMQWSLKPCLKQWDRVFYYPVDEVVYHKPEFAKWMGMERCRLMDAVIARADSMLAEMYQTHIPPIIIHGDLHFYNVHEYKGQLYILDFEALQLGYPIQDIAITMYYCRDHAEFHQLYQSYQKGYESVRRWPEVNEIQMAMLLAARNANMINYVLSNDLNPTGILDGMFSRLKIYAAEMGVRVD